MPEHVRLILSDVDGVLTDGTIQLDERGMELKRFSVLDGAAVAYLRRAGIPVAWISGRSSRATLMRAHELGIAEVYQGRREKWPVAAEIIARHGLKARQVAYLGDDLADLAVLTRVGFPATVADARPEVKATARWIAPVAGGHGALRALAEHVLVAQGAWAAIVDGYRT